MNELPVQAAAQALNVRPGTLMRWLREGCPHVPGRRGRGHAALVDIDLVKRWRGLDKAEAAILELAAALPQILAEAAQEAHCLTQGPIKPAAAGVIAGTWFISANAVLDHLRKHCATVPEIKTLPAEIQRLQKIAKHV